MKIVIDIPDFIYEEIRNLTEPSIIECNAKALYNAIYHGTPLLKGHGRLVDISRIDEDKMEQDNPIICITMNDEYIEAVSLDYLNNLPTIIEGE